MVPWVVTTGGDAGAAVAPGDAGVGSGCTRVPVTGTFAAAHGSDVRCGGSASVRRAGADFALVFADGSVLAWDQPGGAPAVSVPGLADGDSAWVDFSRLTTVVCPFCGSYPTTALEVRGSAGGPLLWIGREGPTLDDINADLVSELFGVGVHEEPACQESFSAGCFNVTRQRLDHVIETTPAQVVHAGGLSLITTPKGEYDVLWAHSSEQSVFQTNCADGPGVATDTGFAASRRTTPIPGNQRD